ncbi:MAG: hypothetical protein A3B68_03635 [Candidatus Melainabacteria bacterium RIFCSPHIGHO2_02_FULL_34_12]|nr:MAG: hypothetical protein A3B68_03635 [Candidatus Melainabacteria bacterium RIFCSPHIGHO2_02_FULL_34_12]
MSVSRIKSTALAIPGDGFGGTKYRAADGSLERKVLEQMGLVRRGFSQLGRFSPFFNVQELKPEKLEQLTRYQRMQRAIATELKPYKKLEPIRTVLNRAELTLDFIKRLPEYIEIAGIREKYTVDNSSKHDPLEDMGVYLIKKLIEENGLDVDQVDALYVATTTSRANDPPITSRILSRLSNENRGKYPAEVLEKWKTKVIAEGCVGSVKALDEIERDMFLKKANVAIVLYLANNSMHMKGNNPHEIINYGDGGAGMLIVSSDDSSGPLVFGTENFKLTQAAAVTHNMKRPENISLWARVLEHFHSNVVSSKKVAKDISNRVPPYMLELMKSSRTSINDYNHIFLSQTSAGVVKRIELAIAEDYGTSIGIERLTRKGSENIYDYFYKLVDSGKQVDSDIYEALNDTERNLLEFMMLLHDTVVRVYQIHGYTGVASIPMALAHYVKEGLVDLDKDNLLLVASGLGGKIQGANMLNSKVKQPHPAKPILIEKPNPETIESLGDNDGHSSNRNGSANNSPKGSRLKEWLPVGLRLW